MPLIAGIIAIASSSAIATTPSRIWLYSSESGDRWCVFLTDKAARGAAASGKFGGVSAYTGVNGDLIDTLIITSESEDAFAEDAYTFDARRRLTSITRRGHYINDPVLSVVFTRAPAGKLRLTPASLAARKKAERDGHETYWIDWELYPNFEQLPFARLLTATLRHPVNGACRAAQTANRLGE